jgi:hypothetical protein
VGSGVWATWATCRPYTALGFRECRRRYRRLVAHVAHNCFAPLSWSVCHHPRHPCQSANFHYNLRGASLFELM